MSLKQRWQAEETLFGKIFHRYVSLILAIAGAAPEVLMWYGALPANTVPQYFWTIGIAAGSIAKVAGKLTMNKNRGVEQSGSSGGP